MHVCIYDCAMFNNIKTAMYPHNNIGNGTSDNAHAACLYGFSVASMSNANTGKTFNAIAQGIGRDDIGEILFNWNESQLNFDGDRIIGYPGKDGRFTRGKEGGKVNISKREFLDWLLSDSPFDKNVYGANIRNDAQWTGLIQRARKCCIQQHKISANASEEAQAASAETNSRSIN